MITTTKGVGQQDAPVENRNGEDIFGIDAEVEQPLRQVQDIVDNLGGQNLFIIMTT